MEFKSGEELRELNCLYKELDDVYHSIALKLSLSDSAFTILYTLSEIGEGCSQKDICSQASVSKKTINSAILKLEQENYIYMKHGKGRAMQIFLTPKGHRAVEEKIYPVIQIENNVFQKMEEQEARQLLWLFRKYVVILRDAARSILEETK